MRTFKQLAQWLVCGLVITTTTSSSAHAWDPTTTHQGMLEATVRASSLHQRWMDSTELRDGIFSELQIVPELLTPDERRLIEATQQVVPADSGALPRGGPASCIKSRGHVPNNCVAGDKWEQSGLGWMRFGIFAKLSPNEQLSQHFFNQDEPGSETWEDPSVSSVQVRARNVRRNGATVASFFTRTGFDGAGTSAVGWLNSNAVLSPSRFDYHRQLSIVSSTSEQRGHHRAMSLICIGAILHVVQDAALPSHARGDLASFFARLSSARGDRGLVFQEFTKNEFGRTQLPVAASNPAPTESETQSLKTIVLGAEGPSNTNNEGLVPFARSRFLSSGHLPAPTLVDRSMSAKQAAKFLIDMIEGPKLLAIETQDATLSGWPAQSGYLLSSTGRPLAAYETTPDNRTRLFLDATVHRDQAGVLIPQAIEASRKTVNLLWQSPKSASLEANTNLSITTPLDLRNPTVRIFEETSDGVRTETQAYTLPRSGPIDIVIKPQSSTSHRVVVVTMGTTSYNTPWITETTFTEGAAGESQ